ncbi:Bacterial type II secretion system protein F domain [marine gamma proteobacterium HTCC2148]|nr:Bacterial type II secretion system protein F domain [marine gamma proteobacterium HTCC2148]
MGLIIAYALIAVSVTALVYAGLQSFVPVAVTRWRSDQEEIDDKLQNIFYTSSEARTFLILKYGGTLAAFFIGLWFMNSLVFGIFLGIVIYLLPEVLLDNILRRRRERLEAQTADVMTALSASIKSGMTIEQAFSEMVDNMYPPISEEFALIRERIDAGQPVIAAVKSADERLQVPRLSLIFQTICISLERGGRLASLMDRLAESTREIERVEERVRTETAGLRLSARIMFLMPFFICGLLYLIEPDQVMLLFDNLVGNIVLVIAIAMDISAYFIMKKLIELDI